MTKDSHIIVVNKNTPRATEAFGQLGTVRPMKTEEITPDTVQDADILVVRSETRVDRQLLEGSKVKFVGTVTIGTDHCDLDYLRSRSIGFASAPGSNSNSVAEYVAAALLTWSQRTRQGLSGKSIGIVGVGNVGKKVARVAQLLGLNVLLNDPPLQRLTGDSSYIPLDDLMEADFVSLHVPLTRTGKDATYHSFDENRFGRMKRGSVLINTSRGGVIETSALRAAISSGHLSTAILDVWEGEPRIDTALLDRVMLGTPHIAGYSLDGKLNAVQMVAEEVARFLNVPFEWAGDAGESESHAARIHAPDSAGQVEQLLNHIVHQAYDIELDDYLLRKIMLLLPAHQGEYFMKLRAEYRTRREFSNRVVDIPEGSEELKQVLHDLGFMTEVSEAAK
jgi:erythronate-4-phosphate dehydrogenase